MAGISSTSQNIILQGTITRLTDISSPERRKIIENLVGIAQYGAEKADAEADDYKVSSETNIASY